MTTTETSTSTFFGTLVIGDDIKKIEVDATGGGPEQVAVVFTLPDYTALPRLYLTPGKARELRDLLTEALGTLADPVKLAAVSL